MSEAAKLLIALEKEDLRILMAIEIGMKRSEYVTVDNIRFYSRYKLEETLYRLKKVHKHNLIVRNSSSYKIGYTLNSIGYDVLALHALVEKKVIGQLGPILGKGKESDVYSSMDDDENIFALKIFRMGRTSFKRIKQLRDLVGDRGHSSWLYINRLAARREFDALTEISKLKLDTPKPIAYNRHMIVMSYLKGKELVYHRDLNKPEKIFNNIIKQMKKIYQEAKIVHGDLGEYNIVVDEKGNFLIIDWVQWVSIDHPNARSLLKRDILNLSKYFNKKFNIQSDAQDIMASFFN